MGDLKSVFAYSWTRQEKFYYCPRRFYWHYYGSLGGWEDEATRETRLAYLLKQIKSVAVLIGQVFHEVIGAALRARPVGASDIPAIEMRQRSQALMRQRLQSSRHKRWQSGNPKYNTILLEDYYGSGVTEQDAREGLEVLDRCVDGFAHTRFGKRVFEVHRDELVEIESSEFTGTPLDGVPVHVRPDLVVRGADASLHIVDWKTGKRRQASHAQLALYGLAVSERRAIPLERLTANLVYVGERRSEQYPDLGLGVEEARRGIATFVSDVRSRLTDPDANIAGDIDAFPMTTNVGKCRSCEFRELCGRTGETALAPTDESRAD